MGAVGVRILSQKTGKKGAQKNNTLAVKHHAYRDIDRIDGRTREGKALRFLEATLVTSLGGDVSAQETALIQRAAFKLFRCGLLEKHLMALETKVRMEGKPLGSLRIPEHLTKSYLQWSREARADLMALGLERRAKPVQDLQAYLSETYGIEGEK